jgi:aldose 1-epimerase
MSNPIIEKKYGSIDNQDILEYTISNASGFSISVINYGATLTGIQSKDKQGNLENVLLHFDNLDGYRQKNNPYFGAIVGRYANRIGKAKFELNRKEYVLAANNNGNSLHGGIKGFDKNIWTTTKLNDSSVKFSYTSVDGEEGYPGNLTANVIYTVTADNEVTIDYTAISDKPTPVNLTNHAYFNLSGGQDSTILAHDIMIEADSITEVDKDLVPTGRIISIKGGPMDFTAEKNIGKDISKVEGGYDHNWVLNDKSDQLKRVAELYHAASGRAMEVFTTQPGLQFYTGNFLDGALANTGDKKYVKNAGLCLETQHFPDSPNQPAFPNTILNPGETFHQVTAYKFSTR